MEGYRSQVQQVGEQDDHDFEPGRKLSNRSFRFEPPKLFRLYEVPGYGGTPEVPTADTTIGWGIEFPDGAVSVLFQDGEGGRWSVGMHRDAKDAAALYSMVSPVGAEYVLTS